MATKTTKTSQRMRTQTSRARATRTNAHNMSDGRNQRFMLLVALLTVALVGTIGVALAAFATEMNISGTATVKSTAWDIHFENLQEVALTGANAKEITTPAIDEKTTKIADYKLELVEPGDAAEYTFDVKNAGDFDAEITSVTIKTGNNLTCTSTEDANAATRNANVCKNLNYTLKYADGTAVAVGDTLPVGESKTLKLKLEFSAGAEAADLPDAEVAISGLDVVITYGQKTATTK